MLVHDVIGFGRGETPARRVSLLQVLDGSHRLIFELVAGRDRRLYLTSPAGGLRATPLVLATGAIVPNDGISGVAVDVALKAHGWLLVTVNGVRTATVRRLVGARTGPPRFLAAGVIGYKAPPSAGTITATHAQVSVTTPTRLPRRRPRSLHATVTQPASQPFQSGPPLSSLSPPTISGTVVVGEHPDRRAGELERRHGDLHLRLGALRPRQLLHADIGDADGRTYDLVSADRGAFVRVRVTAHVGDDAVSRASAAVGPVVPTAPTDLGAPSITGDAVVGERLTADPGSLD